MMKHRRSVGKKSTTCLCNCKTIRSTCAKHGQLLLLAVIVAYFILNIFYILNHNVLGIDHDNQKTVEDVSIVLDIRKYIAKKSSNITKNTNIKPKAFNNSENNTVELPLLENLQKENRSYCGGNIKYFSSFFAVVNNVTVDTTKVSSIRKGGESISEVLNQTEKEEFIDTQPGFFQLPCEKKPPHTFSGRKDHLKAWENSVDIIHGSSPVKYKEDRVTFAIVRTDYANLYWMMVELYDVFFLTKFLGLNINEIGILFVDAHPISQVDDVWYTLFPKVTRIGHVTHTILYRSLVWSLATKDSPLVKKSIEIVPFLNEFRDFVLSKTNYVQKKPEINCKNVTISIIFRRNYVAHPRNPSGRVSRKIANEQELLGNVSLKLSGHNVKGVQLDHLSVNKQIELASKTDILVGMHGAGLAYTILLPSHAALIELFPWSHLKISHFESIASWRSLTYFEWRNEDAEKDIDEDTTIVDVQTITSLITKAYIRMCPS